MIQMIEFLNRAGAEWAAYFWMANWQNAFFLGFALLVMHFFRRRHPRFVRAVGLLALLKLLFPPLISGPSLASDAVVPVFYGLSTIPVHSGLANAGSALPAAVGWFFLGWLAISGAMIAAVCGRYVRMQRIAGRAVRFRAAENLCELPRHCRAFRSEAAHSPFVVGFWRHRIVFPAAADTWPADAIRTTLAHEVAHIRLWDHWVNLLQLLAQALFWINPLVWWLNRRFNEAREMVCDELAAEMLGQTPAGYARNLVDLAAKLVFAHALWLSPLFFVSSENHLKNRILYQLENKGDAMKKWTRIHVLIFAGLSLLLLPLSCDYSDPSRSSDDAPTGMALSKAEEEGVVPFSELTEKPVEIKRVRPKYPEAARAAGMEGLVVVRVRIGTDGRVEETKMLKSIPIFDVAAMEAARQFEFKPGKVNGKPVKVWVAIPFNFRLKEKEAAGDEQG